MARYGSSLLSDIVDDIVDDIKDFVDDVVVDRAKGAEKDLRKAGRNWTDPDDAAGSDLDEREDAVAALTTTVDALAKK